MVLLVVLIIFVIVVIYEIRRDAKIKPGKPRAGRCPWCGETVKVRADGSFCCGWCGNFGKLPCQPDWDGITLEEMEEEEELDD